jgi:RNA recognition motif-containing protein
VTEVRKSFAENKKTKDFVFVDFATEEGALKALELDKTLFHGRHLKIQQARAFNPQPRNERFRGRGGRGRGRGGGGRGGASRPQTSCDESWSGPKSNADFRKLLQK